MKNYKVTEIKKLLEEKNIEIDNIKIVVPKNMRNKRIGLFMKTIYSTLTKKYNLTKNGNLHNLPISLFSVSDFKKNTSFIGFLTYIEKYIGCRFSNTENELSIPDFYLTQVLLSFDDFYFFNEKEKIVLKKRFIENLTLTEVGKIKTINISRERVRQIEQKIFHYLKMFLPEYAFPVFADISPEYLIFCSSKIKHLFTNTDGEKVFQYFLSSVNMKEFKYKYSNLYEIYYNPASVSVPSLVEKIKNIQHSKGQVLLTSSMIASLLGENAIFNDEVSSCLIDKKILVKHNEYYFLYPKTKSFAVELFIAFQKNGYSLKDDFGRMINWLNEIFPDFMLEKGKNIKKENFNSFVEHNERIILWGWGRYSHFQNIEKSFSIPLKDINIFIEKEIKNNLVINSIQIFDKFKEICVEYGIPDHNALYSVLRTHLQDNYSFKHCPWIRDKDIDGAKIIDIIAAMLKEHGEKVAIRDIAFRFGIDSLRITQLLSRSDLVESAGRGFFIYKSNKD